jgi:hypothetical protein
MLWNSSKLNFAFQLLRIVKNLKIIKEKVQAENEIDPIKDMDDVRFPRPRKY